MADNEAKRWVDEGERIALEHKKAVLWLMKEMPELTVEKALEAHICWLAAKFMVARHTLLSNNEEE